MASGCWLAFGDIPEVLASFRCCCGHEGCFKGMGKLDGTFKFCECLACLGRSRRDPPVLAEVLCEGASGVGTWGLGRGICIWCECLPVGVGPGVGGGAELSWL